MAEEKRPGALPGGRRGTAGDGEKEGAGILGEYGLLLRPGPDYSCCGRGGAVYLFRPADRRQRRVHAGYTVYRRPAVGAQLHIL